MQESGLIEIMLWYSPQVSGASILFFSSLNPQGSWLGAAAVDDGLMPETFFTAKAGDICHPQ